MKPPRTIKFQQLYKIRKKNFFNISYNEALFTIKFQLQSMTLLKLL